MERLRFRSTSLADLQAELHERELLRATEPRRDTPMARHRRTAFGLRIAWRRSRSADRP